MINIKTIKLTEAEKITLERAMRKSSLKRTRALDFVSTVSDIGSNKLFIGYDGKKDVQFSRLRTSFEKFMPRAIVILSKNETEIEYRIRYSLLSTVVVVFWALGFIVVTATALVNKYNYEGIIVPLVFFGGFVLLTMLELNITGKRIQKAITLNP
ncbi:MULTISPECIES: hypothetical protein [unclassified Mucilaginibacter]|uniref:hypothetical protein n=1 Tax=unclassified Mucilaginibacter TaxID=2617802 RepID=UPI002AC8EA69|nr:MULTISPECIES: hypothetical protein [unclassified Mucilaginibacter]MEB0263541.1 hypothetical protein [Mucilaginibacter sp. 10I4]MEB0277733.1 hypothetical protein [Mucilaginibacter sp. 10B2]MEB0302774.1 hypothetical protein [Mucilaginibacter sp. 5C4]WPX24642.1 hypothetical protein RHM67_05065 [Mucilaginibacter sp. 5C4]